MMDQVCTNSCAPPATTPVWIAPPVARSCRRCRPSGCSPPWKAEPCSPWPAIEPAWSGARSPSSSPANPSRRPLSTTPSPQAMCRAAGGAFPNPLAGPRWNAWGVNTANTRYQDGPGAGFTAADVPRLSLKWAFGLPGELSADGQPTDGRRPCVLRDAERGRVFAQRRHGLRPLVFSGRRRRARRGQHRPRQHTSRRPLRGVRRRPRRHGLRGRCGHRCAAVENESGRSSRSPGSRLPRRFTTAGSTWALPPEKRRPAPWPITSAADSAAASSRSTPRPGHRSGRPTRSPKSRCRGRRTRPAHSCGAPPARPSGRARRSTPGGTPSTSPPATTTALQPPARAMRSWRSISIPGRCCGPAR